MLLNTLLVSISRSIYFLPIYAYYLYRLKGLYTFPNAYYLLVPFIRIIPSLSINI